MGNNFGGRNLGGRIFEEDLLVKNFGVNSLYQSKGKCCPFFGFLLTSMLNTYDFLGGRIYGKEFWGKDFGGRIFEEHLLGKNLGVNSLYQRKGEMLPFFLWIKPISPHIDAEHL